jgi:hypothetical protein
MGTSNAYGGPGGGTPLIPSWLEPPAGPIGPSPGDGGIPAIPTPGQPLPSPMQPPALPPIPPPAEPGRYRAPRGNFSRYASSGGGDRRNLGRALSRYVSGSSGGAGQAARRMGASRTAGANLISFLRDAAARGTQEALRALRFDRLVGKPIEDIFLGLAEYVCPDGGTIDEGIAREAYMETIADLAEAGITDIDALTLDQVQTIFELYAANAIEARIYNDIGTNVIQLPQDAREVLSLQTQLHEFILRSVSDAMTHAREGLEALTRERSAQFVTRIYEQAFGILKSLGEAEVDR